MFDYIIIFPIAVIVAILANSSGFSGSVLFQPFFNFVLQIPIEQSISTGIATETIGMTSGAFRYWKMGKIDFKSVKKVFPYVYVGIISGIFLFIFLPKLWLRLVVGLTIFSISTHQLYLSFLGKFGTKEYADLSILDSFRSRFKSFASGVFSASTGTGMAEIHQPMFEHDADLDTKRSNATAITIEALGNWLITILNISLGNINFQILFWSAAGTIIGAQIGALLSPFLPDKILKIIFGLSVSMIGLIYIFTSVDKIMFHL